MDTHRFGDSLTLTGKCDLRLTRRAFDNFDIRPGHFAAQPGAEHFEDGFLRGKTTSQVLEISLLARRTIFLLASCEYAVEKSLAVVFDQPSDALHLN